MTDNVDHAVTKPDCDQRHMHPMKVTLTSHLYQLLTNNIYSYKTLL